MHPSLPPANYTFSLYRCNEKILKIQVETLRWRSMKIITFELTMVNIALNANPTTTEQTFIMSSNGY